MNQIITLIVSAGLIFTVLGLITLFAHVYSLNIKNKTVGNGQHGTARWATKKEIRLIYTHIPFLPETWRRKHVPKKRTEMAGYDFPAGQQKEKHAAEQPLHLPQGIVVGCTGSKLNTTAMVDEGDVHALMIGAAGVGKTAYFLYPNLEYACASGMSFVCTDTKGDLFRNYGGIARDHYGYNVAVIDLRNPTKSDGNNLLHLVNKYMALSQNNPDNLGCRAKAEKYAKIIAKTIILSGMDSASFGQNAFFVRP